MGQLIRAIPYKSQYDLDASEFRNDCGPACVAMILNGLGVHTTTNTVFRRSGAKANQYVSVSQMIRAAQTFNINFDYFYPWGLNDLKLAIQAGKAPIALIHYGALERRGLTQSSFTGPHFVVAVGYDRDSIYIHDPLWWGTRRWEGERRRIPNRDFEAAWSSASKDGNRNYSGIYCTHRLPVVTYGQGGDPIPPPEPPAPPYEVDPGLKRRLLAWAASIGVPLKPLDSQAVVTAYSQAMGSWGERVEPHEVTSEDTLPLLALRYYDDPLKWQVISYFNGLSAGDTIHDGDILLIPEPLERPVEIPPQQIPTGNTPQHTRYNNEVGLRDMA